MPGRVLLMTLIVGVAQVGAAHLRCQDAVRAAARLAARGEPAVVVLAAARSAAPGGAVVRVGTAGGRATVRIDTRVPVAGLSGLTVSATAVAALEQP